MSYDARDPDIVEVLWHFGLITEEQAAANARQWEMDRWHMEKWDNRARAEWKKLPWWTRFKGWWTVSQIRWMRDWIQENDPWLR